MKLLIITQVVDKKDPVLGFFHNWINELSGHYESISVITLKKGETELPQNVSIYSLGKENGESKIKYLINFYKYIWQLKDRYDAVFVHMNQEYILLAGLIWLLQSKKVYMWRNHHAGNILTDIAGFFCTNVFCTSKFSYTAKFKKTVLMPIGIDTKIFKTQENSIRKVNSILYLGRIAPVKRPDLLIRALVELRDNNFYFIASIYGDALPIDADYLSFLKDKVKQKGLEKDLVFYPGIPNAETVQIYNQHEIFVNLSSSGMYDKTIFEAMACGCLVLASNKNLYGLVPEKYIFNEGDLLDLKNKLVTISKISPEERENDKKIFRELAEKNSLDKLAKKISEIVK